MTQKYLRRFVPFLVLVLSLGGIFAYAEPSKILQITMDDVVKKVSTENFTVYANALKVYQARQSIQVARGNLLPKLNFWRLATGGAEAALGSYTSAVGLVQDLAPFLVPANWFRLKQQKILYKAEQEGYRALWANELMTAKSMYVHLLLDNSLFEQIYQSRKDLEEIYVIVRSRELLGGMPQGASRDIEIRLLALKEDHRSLEVMIQEEKSLLSFMMGLPAEVTIEPVGLAMPNFDSLLPLEYGDFEFRVTDTAPEIRQFEHFIQAADYVRSEVMYSFLGTSNLSRGVAGGIFDSIPISDGLGFGTPASMRMVSAQKEILKVQKQGVKETLLRHLKLLIEGYNLDIESYANLKRRAELTAENSRQLKERLTLGEDIETQELIEASRNLIQADTAFFAIQFRFLSSEDRLARLIFHGDYSKEPIEIETLRKRESL